MNEHHRRFGLNQLNLLRVLLFFDTRQKADKEDFSLAHRYDRQNPFWGGGKYGTVRYDLLTYYKRIRFLVLVSIAMCGKINFIPYRSKLGSSTH
jgi:hypothetical protein